MNRMIVAVIACSLLLTGLPVRAAVPGDFDGNSLREATDLDFLTDAIFTGDVDPLFDLNNDGDVNWRDRTYWIETLANTWYGDSNLDGEFNTSDFITVFIANKYETGERAGWADGDWNGDQLFNSNEFHFFFLEIELRGFERGPRPGGFQPVPEPPSLQPILCLFLALIWKKRNRQKSK